MHGDGSRELRSRIGRAEDVLANMDDMLADPGMTLLGVTAQKGATYPTAANSFVYIQITSIAGDETEGAVPTFGTTTDFLWALCLGAIPAIGTRVLAKSQGAYWVI